MSVRYWPLAVVVGGGHQESAFSPVTASPSTTPASKRPTADHTILSTRVVCLRLASTCQLAVAALKTASWAAKARW